MGMDVCGIVSAANATGKPVRLRSSLFSFMKPLAVSSMMACGTWSPRQSRAINPPLSKEICLQTHGQDGDCWEEDDCQDGDRGQHDEQEEGDSSEESN